MKTILSYSLLIIICFSLLTGCSVQKYQTKQTSIWFTPKKSEIIRSENLKKFLSTNKKKSVVFRSKINNSEIIKENNNDDKYETIIRTLEKVFVDNGYEVRDRSIFNQIIKTNDGKLNNYKKIKELTNTDLIIEIVDYRDQVVFSTNQYYGADRVKKTFSNGHMAKQYGSSIEFKVIWLESNEFGGSAKFYYTPCTNGCLYSMPKVYSANSVKRNPAPVEMTQLSNAVLKDFYSASAQNLVYVLKGNFTDQDQSAFLNSLSEKSSKSLATNNSKVANKQSARSTPSHIKYGSRMFLNLFEQRINIRIPKKSKIYLDKSTRGNHTFKIQELIVKNGYTLVERKSQSDFVLKCFIGKLNKTNPNIVQLSVASKKDIKSANQLSKDISQTNESPFDTIDNFIKSW